MKVHADPSLILSQSARLPDGTARQSDDAALRRQCQEFEAIFLRSLFKGMRATVPEGGLLPRGSGEEVFQELFDAELARSASGRNSLGLAEALYRALQPPDQG